MIKVYDFRCDNGHVYEQFVDSGTEIVGASVVPVLQKCCLPRLLYLMDTLGTFPVDT